MGFRYGRERNESGAQGDPVHGHVVVGSRAHDIHVFTLQEQEHQQLVIAVLFLKHCFIQHVDLLQRANE